MPGKGNEGGDNGGRYFVGMRRLKLNGTGGGAAHSLKKAGERKK